MADYKAILFSLYERGRTRSGCAPPQKGGVLQRLGELGQARRAIIDAAPVFRAMLFLASSPR